MKSKFRMSRTCSSLHERDDVEVETGDCIRTRYHLGLRSPLASDPFLSDIGHLGGPAVQQILLGTCLFPSDTLRSLSPFFRKPQSCIARRKKWTSLLISLSNIGGDIVD